MIHYYLLQMEDMLFNFFTTLDALTDTFQTMDNQFLTALTHRPITVDKTYFSLRSCTK